NVYLTVEGGRREQVGVINFFSFTAPRTAAHAGHDTSGARFEFDATEALQRLGIDPNAKPALVFEPSTGVTGPVAESVAPQVSPEANVRFESAKLVTVP